MIELEEEGTNGSKFKVQTLYKTVRALESEGHTGISCSYIELERPERRVGDADRLDVKVTQRMDYVLSTENRNSDSYTSKTVFGFKLARDKYKDNPNIAIAQRFRFVPIAKTLKPVKPYMITKKQLELKKDKPLCIHD